MFSSLRLYHCTNCGFGFALPELSIVLNNILMLDCVRKELENFPSSRMAETEPV